MKYGLIQLFPVSRVFIESCEQTTSTVRWSFVCWRPRLVYASESGMRQRIEDRLFPLYRYYKQLTSQRRPPGDEQIADQ